MKDPRGILGRLGLCCTAYLVLVQETDGSLTLEEAWDGTVSYIY
jgi:hypothetical protein